MTDNEATKTAIVRTRPALHEDEVGCYEAEAEILSSKAIGLNIRGCDCQRLSEKEYI